MAAQGSCQCALLSTRVPNPLKPPPHALPFPYFARSFVASRACRFWVRAELGGEGEVQKGGKKKKFITKEEEPEQFSPMIHDPLSILLFRLRSRVAELVRYDLLWFCQFRYWQTAGEREGENPMMTPLPYIIIFGMSTPFVILAIAFANGWIKVPVR